VQTFLLSGLWRSGVFVTNTHFLVLGTPQNWGKENRKAGLITARDYTSSD
jgi:hypothetical protein